MPPHEYHFWVYIMASRSLQLYVGFTNNLRVRVSQHKELRPGTYTARYRINRLVYCEHFTYVNNAIARENELKGWLRSKKLALICTTNPTFIDLAERLVPKNHSAATLAFRPPYLSFHSPFVFHSPLYFPF